MYSQLDGCKYFVDFLVKNFYNTKKYLVHLVIIVFSVLDNMTVLQYMKHVAQIAYMPLKCRAAYVILMQQFMQKGMFMFVSSR